MTINDVLDVILDLNNIAKHSENHKQQAEAFLETEVTTHNIEEAKKFVDSYWRNR